MIQWLQIWIKLLSSDGDRFGFPIDKKNIHFLEGHLRNIPTNNSITHAEEDCSNLSQSECIIDPRSIVEFLIETKIK